MARGSLLDSTRRLLARDVGADIVSYIVILAFVGGVATGVAATTGGSTNLLLLLVPGVGGVAGAVAVLSATDEETPDIGGD